MREIGGAGASALGAGSAVRLTGACGGALAGFGGRRERRSLELFGLGAGVTGSRATERAGEVGSGGVGEAEVGDLAGRARWSGQAE